MFGHRNAHSGASETSDYEDPRTEPVIVDLYSSGTVQVVPTSNTQVVSPDNVPAVSSGFLAPISLEDVKTATSQKASNVITSSGGVFSSLP